MTVTGWMVRQARARNDPQPKIVYGVTIGRSALNLLRGQLRWLSENGWDITLVTSPDQYGERAARREGVSYVPIKMKREISLISDVLALVRWVTVLPGIRAHAVNVSTPKSGLRGGIAAWITRVPRRIYVVRGLRVEGATGLTAVLLWLAERIATSVATDLVFVSQSLAVKTFEYRLAAKQNSWLIGAGSSRGVDSQAIAEQVTNIDREALRHELGFSSADLVVGFAGRITKDRGISTVARAFENSELEEEARLLVTGSTEDSDLEVQLKERGRRVNMVGWTAQPWAMLPAMDVLCLPTSREGFPNVVLEAASAAIPAIITRATDAVDSVVDFETGLLIDIGDEQALVNHLNNLMDDRPWLKRLGTDAQRRAVRDFQPEVIWSGLEEILPGNENTVHARRLY